METKIYFLLVVGFLSSKAFSQTKVVKPLTAKTVAPAPTAKPIVSEEVAKPQNKPATILTDIQTAIVNISTGDDGKDYNTIVYVDLLDVNSRSAATYNDILKSSISGRPNDEYFTGSTVTLPLKVQTSVPTGEIRQVGALPLAVTRYATPADFDPQGEIRITINPDGHDTWKISSLKLTVSFENDPGSPHTITWSNIVLSQDSRIRELVFDKNFNPIQ